MGNYEVDKGILQNRTSIYRVVLQIRAGFSALTNSGTYKKIAVMYMIGILLLAMNLEFVSSSILLSLINILAFGFFVLFTALLLLYLFSSPFEAMRIQHNLTRAGFMNVAGETALYVGKTVDEQNPRCNIYKFISIGIPYDVWNEKKTLLENCLNWAIDFIEPGSDRTEMLVHATSGTYQFADIIWWKDEYLSLDKNILILGETATRRISINFSKSSHIILCGQTGSGKSVLLKTLIRQALLHDYSVMIADFKGGVDFVSSLWSGIKIVDEMDLLDRMLSDMCKEIEYRKTLFLGCKCKNITEYNEKYPDTPLKRRLIVIDELAQVVGKTGLTKEMKERANSVERSLSTLARLGRAFGINLLLATQRPDANVLLGEIKSNIDYRVCGRADNVLSQIVLDNTDAANMIPKNTAGLFLNQDGELFKAYMLDESEEQKTIYVE